MISKNKKRLQITLDEKSLNVINYYFKQMKGITKSQIINAIIKEFDENCMSIGYSDIWENQND